MAPEQLQLDNAPSARGLDQGRDLRDRQAVQADLNTYTPHKELYRREIERKAATGAEFTSDDVMEAVGHLPLGSPGALGALFIGEVRRGTIVAVGHVQSRRASRHGAWIRSYRGA